MIVTTNGQLRSEELISLESELFKAKTHRVLYFNAETNMFDVVGDPTGQAKSAAEADLLVLTRVPKHAPQIYKLIAQETGIPLEQSLFVDDGVDWNKPEENTNIRAAIKAGADGIHYAGSITQLRNEFVTKGLLAPPRLG